MPDADAVLARLLSSLALVESSGDALFRKRSVPSRRQLAFGSEVSGHEFGLSLAGVPG
jgi:hypothetical protein